MSVIIKEGLFTLSVIQSQINQKFVFFKALCDFSYFIHMKSAKL